MSPLQEAKKLLSQMSQAEKAQLMQWVAQDLGDFHPGIEKRPGVQGGDACIVRTRIPVWLLVQYKQMGGSDESILEAYPTLRADNLANAWTYYRFHRDEIEAQIAENETDEDDETEAMTEAA